MGAHLAVAVLNISGWLQLWLHLTAFVVVCRDSPSFISAVRKAYGTAANRHERDHDGLAVWGKGFCFPSAPLI